MEDNRLTDLEITLAHQTEELEALSSQVEKQWAQIDRLKDLLQKSDERVSALEHSADSKLSSAELSDTEKPPHY